MSSKYFHENYDLARMIAKSLYLGMFMNVLIPVALLMVCYFISNNTYMPNRVGDFADPLLYIFGALAVTEAGLAIWLRGKLVNEPMVRKQETFEADITAGLMRVSRPVFIIIATISTYGYVYFFLTGSFLAAVFFVVVSFIAFQVVRPRYGFVDKVIVRQKELVEQGRFLV